MENKILDSEEINFLQKPNIQTSQLPYIRKKKDVYVNLFEIYIKKPLNLFQYPYFTTPELPQGNKEIRNSLFKRTPNEFKNTYGLFFVSGDSIYSDMEINDNKSFTWTFRNKEYKIDINKKIQERLIKQEDIQKDQLSKQFIELIVKDILHHNPNLDNFKDIFVLNNEETEISSDRSNNVIDFYPGYKISFMETQFGNYLNVTLKNNILQKGTILDFLKKNYYEKLRGDDLEYLKDQLIGRSFKVSYAKRNYVIYDIAFERNPEIQTFNYEGETINLLNYYDKVYGIKIKDKKQPIIIVNKSSSYCDFNNNNKQNLMFFVPELCHLAGLDDDTNKDYSFMKKLAEKTKLQPEVRVEKTDKFLELINCTQKKKNFEYSSKERREKYGIDIKRSNKNFIAYYMEEPVLKAGGGKTISTRDRQFPILEKKQFDNWLCLYCKRNYNDAGDFLIGLQKSAKSFGLEVGEPEWYELGDRDDAKKWTAAVDECMGKKKEFDFVVFLLDKNDHLYTDLKRHSLCNSGYISQVVKIRSLKNPKKGYKTDLSVCSKILIQINSKLGGISYKIAMDKSILDMKLMLIGVDCSHVAGKGTGVGMVATMDPNFSHMFCEEKIIEEKQKMNLYIAEFIEKALNEFFKKNKGLPKGIVIYRQGVSLQQKQMLTKEILDIERSCNTYKVPFYYILVNTKTTYKFFEKNKNGSYSNPESGLLIMDGITSRNYFEFYLQPQEVTGGSATPSCFHVAYGNMNFPEMLPKLTYDLCHIYANWQGPVRIPNVIKCAEKLSKMTAKYTRKELHEDIQNSQSQL